MSIFEVSRRVEKMDFTPVDRISNLPDDIIHQILSFIDMKYVVQTSTLSKRWKHIWTSMTNLNFDSRSYKNLSKPFTMFVKHVLSNRNNDAEVSAVELKFTKEATQMAVQSIINYAYLHHIRKLTIVRFARKFLVYPQFIFSCHTIKDLTLDLDTKTSPLYLTCYVPESAWDFPALENLNLRYIKFGGGSDKSSSLFSKCVNLKDLTLHECHMQDLEVFNVLCPKLSNLTITRGYSFPKVFNVLAPQLKNLTATTSVNCVAGSIGSNYLQFSAHGFNSLEKVNLSMLFIDKTCVPPLLDLFQKLKCAKFLTLDQNIIKTLSICEDQLSQEPCPFNNLKCLKIDTTHEKPKDCIKDISNIVKKYLLENSPDATCIVVLPPMPRKRSRKEQDTIIEEQKAKIQKQEKTIAEQNAKIQKQEKIIAEQNAKIQMLEAANMNFLH